MLEKQELIKRTELLNAKTESIQSGKRVEELYRNALDAMKTYNGQRGEPDDK